MLNDKWEENYTQKIPDMNECAMNMVTILKDELNKEKTIITYRVKTLESLKEKIKRKKLDKIKEEEYEILDVLDDAIGIRIICMKNIDEEKIYKLLKEQKSKLSDNKMDFTESIDIQPETQKNGHYIYKIKGKFDQKYLFELQIKSLSNLFWGEMEHLLIYKNNRYVLSSKHYRKEINDIYDELSIIDRRLTFMEEYIINDDISVLLEEKKDVLQRYTYLNLKNIFKSAQGNQDLDNNYIYEAVSEYIFKENIFKENKFKFKKNSADIDYEEEINKQMLNALDFLLTKEKLRFTFNDYNISLIDEIQFENYDLIPVIKEVLNDYENGWWYFIIISSLIEGNKENSSQNKLEILKEKIKECIEYIISNSTMFLKLDSNQSQIIEKQIRIFAKNKDLRIINKSFLNKYNSGAVKILNYLKNSMDMSSEDILNSEELIQILFNILLETGKTSCNIRKLIEELDRETYKIKEIRLSLHTGLLKNNNIITYYDLISYIDKEGEGDVDE